MDINEILTAGENEDLFLLGNEATVRGAIEAGVGLASTYLVILHLRLEMYFPRLQPMQEYILNFRLMRR